MCNFWSLKKGTCGLSLFSSQSEKLSKLLPESLKPNRLCQLIGYVKFWCMCKGNPVMCFIIYRHYYVWCTFRSHLSFSWFALGLHTNKDWCVRWLEMKRYNRNNTSRVCTGGWIKITFIGWIFVQPIFAANQGFKSLWRHRASIVTKNPTTQAKCGFRRNGA